MKTKFDYAQDINFKGNLGRTIVLDEKLDLKIGDTYDNKEKIESWSTGGGSYKYTLGGEYEYYFLVKNVECHKVDYNNNEELETIGAVDCEDENECLVLPTQKFRIIDVSTDEDFEEMGYYEIDLEVIK